MEQIEGNGTAQCMREGSPAPGDADATLPAAGNGTVVCPSCGGEFGQGTARCPYCGTANPSGSEREYLDVLEGLRDDTGRIADEVQQGIDSDLHRSARWIALIIAGVLAFIGVSVAAYNLMEGSEEQRELKGYQEREAFRAQHFEELDQLYDEGDDAALSAYVRSLFDEPGAEALYSWKHKDYLDTYSEWESVDLAGQAIREGRADLDDYVWATQAALRLARLDTESRKYGGELSAEEEARAAGYRADALGFLHDTIGMDDDELESFVAEVEDGQGYIQMGRLREALKPRFG